MVIYKTGVNKAIVFDIISNEYLGYRIITKRNSIRCQWCGKTFKDITGKNNRQQWAIHTSMAHGNKKSNRKSKGNSLYNAMYSVYEDVLFRYKTKLVTRKGEPMWNNHNDLKADIIKIADKINWEKVIQDGLK
jgi:uncharacterized C2H2 Zn-finger protein